MRYPKKVLVAMSGGVDSTMTAWLLKKEGYEVYGIHMRLPKCGKPFENTDFFNETDPQAGKNEKRLHKLAEKLKIPLKILDLKRKFRREIIDPFADAYAAGITPNPCVECNRRIKFGLLLSEMKDARADFLATGHYARLKAVKKTKKTFYEIYKAKDPSKDQSYFLYTLSQNQLKHILFPLGEFLKEDIRRIAGKNGFRELTRREESQDLCFMNGLQPADFLKKYLTASAFKPGPVLTLSGREIGRHKGLSLYTIGQRKRIGLGGISGGDSSSPLYVVRLDPEKNAVIVGSKNDLYSSELTAKNLNFISGMPPKGRIKAKIRYRSPEAVCELHQVKPESSRNALTAKVLFSHPQRAITPGQSVVFYKGEKLLGGGIIA
jgi:tRNA-specific 2-thiouridylase